MNDNEYDIIIKMLMEHIDSLEILKKMTDEHRIAIGRIIVDTKELMDRTSGLQTFGKRADA